MAKKRKRKKRKRTNYVRGREVEYKCKAALVKEGYRIMRALLPLRAGGDP
jgi:hypothetical protein